MAINTWLLGAVITDNCILPSKLSCWQRKDLVVVPDILGYTDDFIKEDSIHVYVNNIGCSIVVCPYGEFESREAMTADYRGAAADSLYAKRYSRIIAALNERYDLSVKEMDWIMPVIEGPLEIGGDYMCVEELVTDNKYFVGMIDCSVIYSCVKSIAEFIGNICEEQTLTKYQQFQLAYYQKSVLTVEMPKCFLTNKTEISLYSDIYEKWGINSLIRNTINNTSQVVSMYSFLADYKSANGNSLFTSFLTFFGIVVGLEAIYNLLMALFSDAGYTFRLVFVLVIILIIAIFFVVLLLRMARRVKEEREYKRKTRG